MIVAPSLDYLAHGHTQLNLQGGTCKELDIPNFSIHVVFSCNDKCVVHVAKALACFINNPTEAAVLRLLPSIP